MPRIIEFDEVPIDWERAKVDVETMTALTTGVTKLIAEAVTEDSREAARFMLGLFTDQLKTPEGLAGIKQSVNESKVEKVKE
jgi:hypothetical protein